jgi:glucose/arabinose dehydrogenase
MAFSRGGAFGHVGEVFVAQFGDLAPEVGKVMAPVGYRVVRVHPETGVITPFAVNPAGKGPASKLGTGGLERPVDVKFSPDGATLYVVDFGVMMVREGPEPLRGTGAVWAIHGPGARVAGRRP